jgi:hypothetical protein
MAKRKQPKKRPISKTEKKLRGKLRYQKTKLKKVTKAIYNDSKANNFDFNKKIGTYKLSTLINGEINDKMKPISNNIRELEKKLKRFNKNKKQKEAKSTEGLTPIDSLGSAWNRDNVEDQLLNTIFQFVDGLNVDTEADLILDRLFNHYYPMLDSTKTLRGWFNSHTASVDLYVDNMTAEELRELRQKRK